MKKLTLLIYFYSLFSFSQDQITNELKQSYQEEKYDWIISEHAEKGKEYPAKAIYYIGMAFYMKAEDEKTLEFMDLSIKKDNSDPDAYFIKGMTYNYLEQFNKAIEAFNKAIELDPSNTHYFSGLGDSFFYKEKYNEALTAYIAATEKDNPIDRPFTMIPQIYAQLNDSEKALEAFYRSKSTISKETDSYITALYNIGLYEYLNKSYDKAEIAFKELIEIMPTDFPSYTKLIQVYYGKKEYEKAKPLKEKLYQAYQQGVLKDHLKNQFCFDQFDWNDKVIFGYERFPVEEGKLYYKHVFYVTDQKSGQTEFTIQTENSPVSVELGGPKYAVGMDKNGAHYTFLFIDEHFEYDVLKNIVLQILDEQIKPTSSSRKN